MATLYDVSRADTLEEGLTAAVTAVRRGELVVLPTDTVYGIGCDAFDAEAVARLLRAKGRGREMPPPVLIPSTDTLAALTTRTAPWVQALVDAYWPGPLTLVCHAQGSLRWDLGDTRGTVAVRMPDDPVALALLTRTGPLAVTSANLTGLPAATDAAGAEAMLGDVVEVILDGGATAGELASTIVDCTGDDARVLRAGALDVAELTTFLAGLGVRLLDPTEGASPGA